MLVDFVTGLAVVGVVFIAAWPLSHRWPLLAYITGIAMMLGAFIAFVMATGWFFTVSASAIAGAYLTGAGTAGMRWLHVFREIAEEAAPQFMPPLPSIIRRARFGRRGHHGQD